MSAPRKDRLEAYLATTRSGCLREAPKGRMARWQRYAAVTGSAMALATNSSLSSLGAGMVDSAPDASLLATPRSFAMAGRSPGLFAAASALETVRATQMQPPVITPNGVVPLYGTVSMIQPGGWVTIYGTNLAAGTAVWNGDFPTSLGGTSVTINGKPAYLSFVSSSQINLQAPDDAATGPVSVVVMTSAGNATATVTLNPYSPSFELLDKMHVAAIIVRANGGGAFGNGAYDILGPDGDCFGYRTVSARAGDLVELFGVGFGPTNPAVPAGKPFSGAAPITNNIRALHQQRDHNAGLRGAVQRRHVSDQRDHSTGPRPGRRSDSGLGCRLSNPAESVALAEWWRIPGRAVFLPVTAAMAAMAATAVVAMAVVLATAVVMVAMAAVVATAVVMVATAVATAATAVKPWRVALCLPGRDSSRPVSRRG